MKFFIALFALAAVALAEPEADPAVFYSNLYGYNGFNAYRSPLTYGAYAHASPYFGYNRFYSNAYYNNFAGYRLFKREAEADPATFYSGLYGYNNLAYTNAHHFAPYAYNNFAYNTHLGYPYAHYPYAHAAVAHAAVVPAATHVTQVNQGGVSSTAAINSANAIPGGYANAGNYVANSAGVVHVAKREAEADPAYFYNTLGYNYAAPAYGYSAYSAYRAPYSFGYSAYSSPFYNRHFGAYRYY